MGFTGLDGGIMVALAAGLWLVYLMPTWFKRREYAAVEKTEIRGSRRMRVLEETAPVPVRRAGRVDRRPRPARSPIRTSWRMRSSVRGMPRLLALPAANYAEETTAPAQAASAKLRIARRLRRTRALVTLVLIAALATVVAQVALMITSGYRGRAWTVLGFAGVAAVVSFAALGRLASIARRRQTLVVRAGSADAHARSSRSARPLVRRSRPGLRFPFPSRCTCRVRRLQSIESTVDHMEALRAAALESDRALREAQESPEVSPITTPERAAASASKYATMGIVGSTDVAGHRPRRGPPPSSLRLARPPGLDTLRYATSELLDGRVAPRSHAYRDHPRDSGFDRSTQPDNVATQ